jgi:hypothetical protein
MYPISSGLPGPATASAVVLFCLSFSGEDSFPPLSRPRFAGFAVYLPAINVVK